MSASPFEPPVPLSLDSSPRISTSLQANYASNGLFWLIYCLTFWLLFSYMVPLSLFVTMEIVKLFQVRRGSLRYPLVAWGCEQRLRRNVREWIH